MLSEILYLNHCPFKLINLDSNLKGLNNPFEIYYQAARGGKTGT